MEVTIAHEGIDYTATVTASNVSIDAAGHWAGDGTISGTGRIEDCAATLPEGAFEALEEGIALAAVRADERVGHVWTEHGRWWMEFEHGYSLSGYRAIHSRTAVELWQALYLIRKAHPEYDHPPVSSYVSVDYDGRSYRAIVTGDSVHIPSGSDIWDWVGRLGKDGRIITAADIPAGAIRALEKAIAAMRGAE